MTMRLLGARTIDELVPEMVDASALTSHYVMTPADNLYNSTCTFYLIAMLFVSNDLTDQPLALAKFKESKL